MSIEELFFEAVVASLEAMNEAYSDYLFDDRENTLIESLDFTANCLAWRLSSS